jgi:quercetin dioxygenase-like cupin family protein
MVTESSPFRRRASLLVAVAGLSLLLTACGGGEEAPATEPSGTASAASAASTVGREVLLDAQELTTLDQPIAYPKKTPAQVTSAIITLEPGQETGWHRHRVPLYVYILEGTLSVEYDAGVVKQYSAGTAFMEAEDVWHNGTNAGEDPVRILTVYMGAEGAKNTVERAP